MRRGHHSRTISKIISESYLDRTLLARSAFLLLFAGGSVAGCADDPLAPNTDVGLTVWAEVSPSTLSIRDSLMPILIRVNVRNPSLATLRIQSGGPPYVFTRDPVETRGLWASFRIDCDAKPLNCGPNTDWWGSPEYVLAPRTTYISEKTMTLQQWRTGGWLAVVGEYRVRAWFNGREGWNATLVLLP